MKEPNDKQLFTSKNYLVSFDKKNTSHQSVQEYTSHQSRSFQKSKIKVGHLNIRSLKNRNHLIQLRLLTCEKDFDILAL